MTSATKAYHTLTSIDRPWGWSSGRPTESLCGKDLHEASTDIQRQIGWAPLALYCVLERARGFYKERGSMPLRQAASKAGLPYSTARKAYAKLKKLGLVEACHCVSSKFKVDLNHNSEDWWNAAFTSYTTEISYYVRGSFFVSKNRLRLFVPKDLLLKWEKEFNFKIGKLANYWNKTTRRSRLPYCSEANKVSDMYFRKRERTTQRMLTRYRYENLDWLIKNNHYQTVDDVTVMYSRTCAAKWSVKEKNLYSLVKSIFSFKKEKMELGSVVTFGKGREYADKIHNTEFQFLNLYKCLPEILPLKEKKTKMQRSIQNFTKVKDTSYETLHPNCPPIVGVRVCIRAYHSTCKKIYGTQSKMFLRTDNIEKSKHFPRLKEGFELLADDSVAPEAWFEWIFKKLQSFENSKFEDKAPPLFMVMSTKLISRWMGWFKATTDEHEKISVDVNPIKMEQMYRLKEYSARKLKEERGGCFSFIGFPPDYAEMRRKEIAEGHHDPRECWKKFKEEKEFKTTRQNWAFRRNLDKWKY